MKILAEDPEVHAQAYFVYDSIYADGYPWNPLDPTGTYQPDFAAISIKAAIGMWALWDVPYTDLLFETVADLSVSPGGFWEGLYDVLAGEDRIERHVLGAGLGGDPGGVLGIVEPAQACVDGIELLHPGMGRGYPLGPKDQDLIPHLRVLQLQLAVDVLVVPLPHLRTVERVG